jgi:uncharacterized protein (DUF2236 family)
MDQQCKNCGEKERCREIFEKLGSSKAPPVLLKVIQAFLLPLILFIVALAVAEKVLTERLNSSLGRNLLALVAGVIVVCLYLAVLKLWRSKH